jgi:hypothetical protein
MIGTLSNTNTTIGLQGNILFNSMSRTEESDWPFRSLPVLVDFEVPATIFHVECGLVDNGLVRQNGTGTDTTWNITSDIMGQNPDDPALFGNINAPIRWLGEFMVLPTTDRCHSLYIAGELTGSSSQRRMQSDFFHCRYWTQSHPESLDRRPCSTLLLTLQMTKAEMAPGLT